MLAPVYACECVTATTLAGVVPLDKTTAIKVGPRESAVPAFLFTLTTSAQVVYKLLCPDERIADKWVRSLQLGALNAPFETEPTTVSSSAIKVIIPHPTFYRTISDLIRCYFACSL
jgi:hypothetical protein